MTVYWTDRAAAAFETLVVDLETIRAAAAIEAAESARLRDDLQEIAGLIASTVASGSATDWTTLGDRLTAAALTLGEAMEPLAAARAFAGLADADPPAASAHRSPYLRRAAEVEAAILRHGRIAALSAYGEALIRRDYDSRRDARSARGAADDRFWRERARCIGAADHDLAEALAATAARIAAYLGDMIIDLAPVIDVTGNAPLPALWWAWRLYADPDRAAELVARNGVKHPAFMPVAFEALAR